jgi:hypothetical protein
MANTEEIAIICNLEELTDYQTAQTRTFAANLSVGLTGTAKPGSAVATTLLQPWLWTVTGMRLFFQTNAADPTDVSAAHSKSEAATLLAVPPLSSDAAQAAALAKALQARLSLEYAATLAASVVANPLFQWQPAAPGSIANPQPSGSKIQQPWPHVLAHAATFPAPLPHALNLVLFFQVPTADLVGVVRVQAAPVLVLTPAGGGPLTYTTENSTPVPPPLPDPKATAPQQGFSWAYPTPTGDTSGCAVAIHQPGFELKPVDLTPGGVATNGNEMWLQPVFEDGNEDWRTTLELRIAEAFDLAQNVIGALRDPFPGPPTPSDPHPVLIPTETLVFGKSLDSSDPTVRSGPLDALRTAVLSLLRDTADYGTRRAPDGASTFRYVIQRIVDADALLPAGKSQLPPNFDVEAFIETAETGPLAAGVLLKDWQTMLTTVIVPTPWVVNGIVPVTVPPTVPGPNTFGRLVGALSDLQKTIAEDATLATLLFLGWNKVLANDAIWTSTNNTMLFATLVQNELNALAATAGLRKRMLLANLGGANDSLTVWSALTANLIGSSDELGQIATNLTNVLDAGLNSRLAAATTPTLDFGPRTPSLSQTDLPLAVPAFLAARLGEQAAAAPSMLPSKAAGASPSPSVHPAVLRIPVRVSDQASTDQLREIAGVCVLLREAQTAPALQKPWSCLNAATLNFLDENGKLLEDSANTPLLADNVVFVPHRLGTRNNLQQMAISYDNRPLAAPSPLADLAAKFSPDDAPGYAPFFHYCNLLSTGQPAGPLADWGRLAGLKYGSSYQAAAFLVRNSGALPPLIAAPSAAVPAPLLPPPVSTFAGPPATAICAPFVYKRRTPLAKVRFFDTNQLTNLNLPSLPLIPDTVLPLARDGVLAPATGQQTATTPLLLLWDSPSNSSYSFSVRPPGADVHVWDRWVAGRPDAATLRGTRAAVYGDFTLNSPKNLADAQQIVPQPAIDISLNDPAATFLCFTLTPILPATVDAPTTAATAPRCVQIPGLTALDASNLQPGQGFAQVQAFGMTTASPAPIVTVTKGATASLTSTPTAVTITVPPGQVWQLSIAPAIDPNLSNHFDTVATGQTFVQTNFTDTAGATQTLGVADNPVQLLIEYAAQISLSQLTLWQAIQFTLPSITSTDLSLRLTPTTTGEWHLLRRVELIRQAWRWMGRPVELDLPSANPSELAALNVIGTTAEPGDKLNAALNWELQAFAERDDSPSVKDAHVSFPVQPAGKAAPPQVLHREDLSKDLRAQYFRFGATFYSRYEGLGGGFQPFTSTSAQSLSAKVTFTNAVSGYTTWTRALVPCRVPANTVLPKPKILLCLPLTAPAFEGAAHTSILVIADEPWYQIGGLSEQLIASIDQVQQYPGTAVLNQIGPDPLVSAPTAPAVPIVMPISWTGTPIGTTFDEASNAPLLAHTCFQFPLASLAGGEIPLDWHMARLRFARSIAGVAASSPQTEGVWVQFLPSSNHFTKGTGGTLDISNATFGLDSDKQQICIYDTSGTPVTLTPGPQTNPATGLLQIWALLMRNITDAAGQPAEAYVGLSNLSASPVVSLNGADHIYLMEIQISPADDGKADLWLDNLFPGVSKGAIDSTGDVTHRVVRISPAIVKSTKA